MRSWMKLIVPALVTLGGPFANAQAPGHDYAPLSQYKVIKEPTLTLLTIGSIKRCSYRMTKEQRLPLQAIL